MKLNSMNNFIAWNDTHIYEYSIDSRVNQLKKKIKELTTLKNEGIRWSVPIPLTESEITKGISNAIGVYKIIYNPTGEIMDIGCGNIGNRKQRHVSVYKNGGTPIIHKGGQMSGSSAALHMYRHDPNLSNWSFQWSNLKSKELAEEVETQLIRSLEPKFNSQHMAGK